MTPGPDNNNNIISLGNPFFEEKGKIIGHRILTVVPETKIEYTISLNGIMNGSVNITDIGTLVSTPIGNRMFYSQGQGVISTEDERETATWTGQGLQTVTDEGKAFFRGSAFYQTTSSKGMLSFLKNIMTIFKSDIDEAGNISNKEWQWK
jgi:hypothetical protein